MNDLSPTETLYQALWCESVRGTITRLLAALVLLFAYGVPAPTALGQSNPRTPTSKDYAKAADALMNVYIQADPFSGTVLVAQHGVPIFRKAYGFANREWSIPNTLETKFRIASVTKQFTAVAILQLREQGKLSVHLEN
jgi:CubicO group peptidase (beta-lactamase class C family)